MTEVTLKVMPKPEAERTLLLRGLDDVTANKAMTAALGSPFDVSGAAHLPQSALAGGRTALRRACRPGAVTLCCGWRASPPRRRTVPRRCAQTLVARLEPSIAVEDDGVGRAVARAARRR